MSIAENLHRIKSSLPEHVSLVAISKTRPVKDITEAYHAGQLDFGENKVQEMTEKQGQLPHNVKWHQVGHLQSNKVKYLAPYVHLIHSVDSLKILMEIEKQVAKYERNVEVLLQMHIAEEESKFGLDESELRELLAEDVLMKLRHVHISGLMGMATNTDNEKQVAKEFRSLRMLFEKCQAEYKHHPQCMFHTLSMGMSGDYQIAVKEGSTMVRVGSAIFGARDYN